MATELLSMTLLKPYEETTQAEPVVYLNLVQQQLGIQSQSPISEVTPTEKQPSP